MGFCDLSQTGNRLDRADFIIGEHDGCEDGAFPDCRFEFLRINQTITVHR